MSKIRVMKVSLQPFNFISGCIKFSKTALIELYILYILEKH